MILRTKTDSKIEQLIWAAKARYKENDGLKDALRCIKVEKNRIVVTNGHQLHIIYIKIGGLEPGFYKVARCHKYIIEIYANDNPCMDAYPPYKTVMPRFNIKKQTVQEPYTAKPLDLSENYPIAATRSTQYTKVVRAMHPESTINYDYFIETMQGMDKVFIPGDKAKPLFFMARDRVALLMPMRSVD